jgi:hypothetical protein
LGFSRNTPSNKGPRFRRAFLPEQALTKMCARVGIVAVPFQRRLVTRLCFLILSLLEIDVAELRMMMRLVEMMNLAPAIP